MNNIEQKEYSTADMELMFDGDENLVPVFVWVVGEMKPAWIGEYWVGTFACCWDFGKVQRPFLMWTESGKFVQGGVGVRVFSRETPPDLEFEQAVAIAIAKLQDAGLWPEEE